MPEEFVLKKFLMTHRAEVRGMLLKEYNEAEIYRLFREDGRKEGREEGDARRLVNAVESLKGNALFFGKGLSVAWLYYPRLF